GRLPRRDLEQHGRRTRHHDRRPRRKPRQRPDRMARRGGRGLPHDDGQQRGGRRRTGGYLGRDGLGHRRRGRTGADDPRHRPRPDRRPGGTGGRVGGRSDLRGDDPGDRRPDHLRGDQMGRPHLHLHHQPHRQPDESEQTFERLRGEPVAKPKRPGGGGNGGNGGKPSNNKPSQKFGGIDAGSSVSQVQNATYQVAQGGRPGSNGHNNTTTPSNTTTPPKSDSPPKTDSSTPTKPNNTSD